MSIVLGTLVTMGLQMGANIINQSLRQESIDEIRRFQQECRSDRQERSLRRDFEKFKRSCEFQVKMEEEGHAERNNNIDLEFFNTFKKMAHNETLKSHYPLTISPYVIAKSVIPLFATQLGNFRTELFCILTKSNLPVFNKTVQPMLDAILCNSIASLWNEKSLHTVCYYSDIWREDSVFYDEDIENLKSVLKSPTLTVTPYFEKSGVGYNLYIKLNMWGVGIEMSTSILTDVKIDLNPELLSREEKSSIVAQLLPIILCSIGYMVDVFYWSNYYQAPLLPLLLSNGTIQISPELKNEMIVSYATLYRSLALGQVADEHTLITTDKRQALENSSELNMFNFPNRCMGFLKSCVALMEASDTSNTLIEKTMLALYKANIGEVHNSLQKINVELLNYDDMNIVADMIDLANKSGNVQAAKKLTKIVTQKIQS